MKLFSMTGFARCEKQAGNRTWLCEIRSVNHRFLQVSLKLPHELHAFEPEAREAIRQRISRGKVDCVIGCAVADAAGGSLDADRLAQALEQIRQVEEAMRIASMEPAAPAALSVLKWPGVIAADTLTAGEEAQTMLTELLNETLEAFNANRAAEGGKLLDFLHQRRRALAELIASSRQDAGAATTAARDKILQRVAALQVEVDAERLAQEAAMIAQKADFHEELDRLDSHLEAVDAVTASPAGKKLDFLAQELAREANTMASKAASTELSHRAIEIKLLIEQMREQIQNIE